MKLTLFAVTSCLCLVCFGEDPSKCGYESCNVGKPDMLNVHIICHTHDDVGWVYTVDEYYNMFVKEIISSVVNSLMQDENRKFSYVEMAFFSKWWPEQTNSIKDYVTFLVKNGRLEFVSGGWSMHDEATTHYSAIIDQMTLGLRWLNDTFGSCATPHTGWQIDPFGHSREHASLFSQMGFDGQFLGRIHYQDKYWRQKTKTMEVLWQASQSLGKKGNLFTAVLPNVYWPPAGFCFDTHCYDTELSENNIRDKGKDFIKLVEEQAKQYVTNNTVLTMGMDFYYSDAAKWYRNLDYLIQHVNSLQALGMKLNVFYSTPACYLYSLNQANMTWPTMTTDFFPYASKENEYWTGYFTSRPAFKYFARRSNTFLQACKQLVALSDLQDGDILTLQKALGVVQHHDGITGTEKQYVVLDYIRQLSKGIAQCQDAISRAFGKLLTINEISPNINLTTLQFFHSTNISQCSFTEMETEFFVIAYNSLGHEMRTFVRLPVLGEGYNITKITGETGAIPAQVVPIPWPILNLAERTGMSRNELVFPATLPPLGLSVYSVRLLQDYEPVNDIDSGRISTSVQDAVIENEYFQVKIDGYTGLMKEVTILQISFQVPLKQSFYFYEGMPSYRTERPSGAYAFNPQFDQTFPLGENVTYRIFKGHLVEEVHQYFTPWISQVIRLYRGQAHIEFDWVVGPIPVHDNVGKEVISRFDSTLDTGGTFFTDSNGRETLKRVRNQQENWHWNTSEYIAGNYYPVTAWIYVQDQSRNLQLSILTDRAEGGSSITNGSIELMVHRRLLYDDGYGVDEPLNELGFDGDGLIVRGTHYLTLGAIREIAQYNKILAKKIYNYPIIGLMKQDSTNIPSSALYEFVGLTRQLPPNVHLLTLEKLKNEKILLRLEHFLEKDDDPESTSPITIALANLFTPFQVINFQETTLAGNKYLEDISLLKWSYTNSTEEQPTSASLLHSDEFLNITDGDSDVELNISLRPMEIRTFILNVDFTDPM